LVNEISLYYDAGKKNIKCRNLCPFISICGTMIECDVGTIFGQNVKFSLSVDVQCSHTF
jgi:hypothetical protein